MIDRRRRDDESLSKNHFLEFEKLAAQLCRTFLDTSRNTHRSGILEVVNDGIEYAFLDAPKQLSFLQGAVLHVVRRLPTTDIQDMYDFLLHILFHLYKYSRLHFTIS